MILTCPSCSTRYEVDAWKFPPQGRDVRCHKCGHTWHEMRPDYVPPPRPEPVPEPVPAPEPEAYVPRVRDLEPQPEIEERPAAAPRMARLAVGAGWVGLGVLVVAVFLGAFLFRQKIVGVWPQSASVYSALGLKVNAAGLQFEDYAYHQDVQDGQVVLTVTGSIRNITNHELPVPQVRVGLADNERRELYHWTFAPEVMTLRPGQRTRFVTRLSSPPQGARQLNLRFAKAGE